MRRQAIALGRAPLRQHTPIRPSISHSINLTYTKHSQLHIQAPPTSTESTTPLNISHTPSSPNSSSSSPPDARFEVLGPTSSVLSIHLSASQPLHTRRGTLIGVSGNPEDALSRLHILSPAARLPLGIPFLYQRLESTTPVTALVASRKPGTSFAVLSLDGRTDWQLASRTSLAAWTGTHLRIAPRPNLALHAAHWGQTGVSGRGLVALAARGAVFSVHVGAGETYVAHPSAVLAYAATARAPAPYRFKSRSFRLQVPGISSLLPDTKLVRELRKTKFWTAVGRAAFVVRTWLRRTVWGDRLFLRFHGPTTLLVQGTAGLGAGDVLSGEQVNEIADSEAGVGGVAAKLERRMLREEQSVGAGVSGAGNAGAEWVLARPQGGTRLSYATVGKGGKVKFEEK